MPQLNDIGPELDIYIVSHGESTANAEKILQGWADYPLSGEGILQARTTGSYLASLPVELDMIYTSPLSRARRTAEEISRRYKHHPVIQQIEEFKEIDIGTLTDTSLSVAEAENPEFFQAARIEFLGFERFKGESRDQFEGRIVAGIMKVFEKHVDGDKILIVGHGGTAIFLVRKLLGLEGAHRFFKLHNCLLAKIERRFREGKYSSRLDYYITPKQQRTLLDGLDASRGLAEAD